MSFSNAIPLFLEKRYVWCRVNFYCANWEKERERRVGRGVGTGWKKEWGRVGRRKGRVGGSVSDVETKF
jgi:hypothetical protein